MSTHSCIVTAAKLTESVEGYWPDQQPGLKLSLIIDFFLRTWLLGLGRIKLSTTGEIIFSSEDCIFGGKH